MDARKTALEKQHKTLEAAIQRLEEDRSLRIALFGVSGSGKSSLLASWYLFRTDRQGEMDVCPDEQSLVYLRTIAHNILNTGQTRSTPAAPPDIIRFQLSTNGEVWDVETMDF